MKKIILLSFILMLFIKPATAQWYKQSFNPLVYQFNSVFFINKDTGWVAGWPIMYTSDGGNNWTAQFYPPMVLNKICFKENNGWAVGDYTILRTINYGSSWDTSLINNDYELYDVCFVNADTGWVVGSSTSTGKGIILKTSDGGNNWNIELTNYTSLNSLYFLNKNFGWVVGSEFMNPGVKPILIYTTNGGDNWSEKNAYLFGNSFSNIAFCDTNTGWITSSGTYGYVYHTKNGGDTLIQQYFDANRGLNSIFFVNSNIGWSVGSSSGGFPGNDGIIINTQDGGDNWNIQASHLSYGLWDVFFIDSVRGWAVGTGDIYRTTNGGTGGIITKNTQNDDYINIRIYPSPATDILTIDAISWLTNETIASVYDMQGQLLLQKTMKQDREEMNIGSLARGVYIIKISSGEGIAVRKFVKE